MYTDLCVSMPFKFHINHANLIDFIRGPPARAAAKPQNDLIFVGSRDEVARRPRALREPVDRTRSTWTGHPSEAHLTVGVCLETFHTSVLAQTGTTSYEARWVGPRLTDRKTALSLKPT